MNALTVSLMLDKECDTVEEKRSLLDSLLEMGQIKESVYRAVNKRLK